MFELNKMLIRKIGWSEYTNSWRPPISIKNVPDGYNAIYYIQPIKSEKTFIITEVSDKQKLFIEYKFVIVNSNKPEVDFLNSLQVEIKSNVELMKLVRDLEACNEEYKRHFKLNRILK